MQKIGIEMELSCMCLRAEEYRNIPRHIVASTSVDEINNSGNLVLHNTSDDDVGTKCLIEVLNHHGVVIAKPGQEEIYLNAFSQCVEGKHCQLSKGKIGVVLDNYKIYPQEGLYQEDVEYTKGKKLGKGNSGYVFKSYDTKTSSICACKRKQLLKFKKDEMMALYHLSGKVISPALYAVMRDKCYVYYFMEFIGGIAANSLIKGIKKLKNEEQKNIFLESREKLALHFQLHLLNAVIVVHENGYAHHDLHGNNVMIHRPFFGRILDYGSSIQLPREDYLYQKEDYVSISNMVLNIMCEFDVETLTPERMNKLKNVEHIDECPVKKKICSIIEEVFKINSHSDVLAFQSLIKMLYQTDLKRLCEDWDVDDVMQRLFPEYASSFQNMQPIDTIGQFSENFTEQVDPHDRQALDGKPQSIAVSDTEPQISDDKFLDILSDGKMSVNVVPPDFPVSLSTKEGRLALWDIQDVPWENQMRMDKEKSIKLPENVIKKPDPHNRQALVIGGHHDMEVVKPHNLALQGEFKDVEVGPRISPADLAAISQADMHPKVSGPEINGQKTTQPCATTSVPHVPEYPSAADMPPQLPGPTSLPQPIKVQQNVVTLEIPMSPFEEGRTAAGDLSTDTQDMPCQDQMGIGWRTISLLNH